MQVLYQKMCVKEAVVSDAADMVFLPQWLFLLLPSSAHTERNKYFSVSFMVDVAK